MAAEDEAAEEGLKSSVGGVSGDDVENGVRNDEAGVIEGGGGVEFRFDEGIEVMHGERAGPGSEELRVGGEFGESFRGGHDALWKKESLAREQPRGRAAGSRPRS